MDRTVLTFDDKHGVEVKEIDQSGFQRPDEVPTLEQVLRDAKIGQKFRIVKDDLIIEFAVTSITAHKT